MFNRYTINYYFGENGDEWEHSVDNSELRWFVKELLSDMDKNSLIDLITDDLVTDEDLFEYFLEAIEQHYEDEAYENYKHRKNG